jgi:muramoyltetrapeptide carboxypeptidase
LNDLIRDPDVDCIISTIGGTNSNSLLPYIDYDAFKQNPKPVIGYSDVSSILLGIFAQTNITTFYGPALVASFGELEPYNELTWSYFADILIDHLNLPHEFIKPDFWTEQHIDWESQTQSKNKIKNHWATVIPGTATGRLIIGNLNTITSIWGSPYMPDINEGDILFIEDSLKSAAMVERLFAFLKVNNVFEKISGLILGKHERFDDMGTFKMPHMIMEEILNDEYNFPFLAQVDCAHTHPMFTMPIGADIELDATNQTIKLISI